MSVSWDATDDAVAASLRDDIVRATTYDAPPTAANCRPSAKAKDLKKAAAGAYKGLFYDNNFDYLGDPHYNDSLLGDSLKRVGMGPITIDAGGQYRSRIHNERNMRMLGLTGIDDDFLLHRTRLFLNAEIGSSIRLYAEYLDAVSNYENFGPRPIEENRSDFLNIFGDFKLHDGDAGALWTRIGRQELLYGAERLISPLDWANTRRTFDGAKAFWQCNDWQIDSFYTKPVQTNAVRFDSPDENSEFMGFWGTYTGVENQTLDLFYLFYNNGDLRFKNDTVGARLKGSQDDWLWEITGAYQYGDNTDGSNHSAGFWTCGFGRKASGMPWTPALWVYYDWASGASNALGQGQGFHHLFPLAHKYLGFMDLYGRRNIETPNVLLTLNPHKKVQLLFWYYYFFLENQNDTPYTVVMTPTNPNNAPASPDLGQEIDFTVNWKICPRINMLFGYSHFFAGKYYQLTPGVAYTDDADFFYTQTHINF